MNRNETNRSEGPVARLTRRHALRIGVLAPLGLTLPHWMALRALAKPQAAGDGAAAQVEPIAKRCILLWLDGGPSHLDTFDPKPEAPQEVRGPFGTISTAVPGVAISELMPRTAAVLDKVALVRSVTSTLGEHNFGSHYMLTGYKPTPVLKYPSYGAVVAHVRKPESALPPYVAIPDVNSEGGAGFLGGASKPFTVGGDPSRADFRVRDLEPYAQLGASRTLRRRQFLGALEGMAKGHGDASADGSLQLEDSFQQAFDLLESREVHEAFDLNRENPATRQKYGPRTVGQSCLLARRLIEAGVPFVTVTDRGWDTHDNLVNRLKEGYTGGTVGKIPTLDLAYSALLEDLDQRGLLSETLVVMMGEFGRTPKVNTLGGRDHWPRVFTVALAGGGVQGGKVIGASDARAESPHERPVLPEDLARTIYTLLGVDPSLLLYTSDGRPVAVNSSTRLVEELVA